MNEAYKRKPNTKCIVCNRPVYRRPSILKNSDGKVFCTMACYGISCRKEIPCIICGAPILAGKNKKTCSRGCANTNRAGMKYKLTGQPVKDKVKTQRLLKARLLAARGGTCERCGYDKYEILHVHHKDRNRNNNALDNLELVCPNCHYEEHHAKKVRAK